jgi:hypothetical protein
MSKVVITGNASGTGDFTIAAPNSNTDRTLTLPDETGTVLTTAGVPSSALPAGSLLQVVNVHKSDTFSYYGFTWLDVTGLSVSITPSSTSSKILVTGAISIGSSADFSYIRLVRDSTVINVGDAASNRVLASGAGVYAGSQTADNTTEVPITYLDSPATTSAVTYKIQMRSGSGASNLVYINRTHLDRDTTNYEWRTASSITVMEIAG